MKVTHPCTMGNPFPLLLPLAAALLLSRFGGRHLRGGKGDAERGEVFATLAEVRFHDDVSQRLVDFRVLLLDLFGHAEEQILRGFVQSDGRVGFLPARILVACGEREDATGVLAPGGVRGDSLDGLAGESLRLFRFGRHGRTVRVEVVVLVVVGFPQLVEHRPTRVRIPDVGLHVLLLGNQKRFASVLITDQSDVRPGVRDRFIFPFVTRGNDFPVAFRRFGDHRRHRTLADAVRRVEAVIHRPLQLAVEGLTELAPFGDAVQLVQRGLLAAVLVPLLVRRHRDFGPLVAEREEREDQVDELREAELLGILIVREEQDLGIGQALVDESRRLSELREEHLRCRFVREDVMADAGPRPADDGFEHHLARRILRPKDDDGLHDAAILPDFLPQRGPLAVVDAERIVGAVEAGIEPVDRDLPDVEGFVLGGRELRDIEGHFHFFEGLRHRELAF